MNTLYFHNEIRSLKDALCFELERNGFWSEAARLELTDAIDSGFGGSIDQLIEKYDREKALQNVKFCG